MISNPTDDEKYLIFRALARSIETNSGIGFQNADQGHPAYVVGAKGEEFDSDRVATWGDGPEQNQLLKLLQSFDRSYHEDGPDLSTWQKFCSYAVAAYNRSKG